MAKNSNFDYFKFFQEISNYACQSSKLLEKVMSNYQHDNLADYMQQMHALEHAADLKKHEMMKHLMKEFLPPLDRDDIVGISNLLDEICDTIEEVLLLMYMNDIKTCRDDVYKITKIIVDLCQELQNLFNKFGDFKRDKTLKAHIVKVNTVEEDGDSFYLEARHRLATDGTVMPQILYWREIYNCLENCCDCCERVADAVEEVLMKNT